MVSFTVDGTIDGVVHIFGPNRNIFTRIFWTLLFILSIYGLFYYIHGAYKKWLYTPDIFTRTRSRKSSEFPSFAITICPTIMSGARSVNFTKL
jgi:hypothetical protein